VLFGGAYLAMRKGPERKLNQEIKAVKDDPDELRYIEYSIIWM
jgi:hypothetical protein